MKFRAKPIEVQAEQFVKGIHTPGLVRYNPRSSPEGFFKGKHGDSIIESGDWVVIEPSGDRYIMSDAAFKEQFEEVK